MTKKDETPKPAEPTTPSEPAKDVAAPAAPASTPPAYVPPQQAVTAAEPNQNLAITSMVLGIVSVVAFGLLTGIPAIITGSIALKKKQPGRGMSITGIITGAVGTLFSVLVVAFFILMVIFASNNYNNSSDGYMPHGSPDMYMYDGDRT